MASTGDGTPYLASFQTLLSRGAVVEEVSCTIPLPLPSHSGVREYAAHIIAKHGVHEMFHDELFATLTTFIRNEEERLEEERDDALVDSALREGRSIDVEGWSGVFDECSADALADAVAHAESHMAVMRGAAPERVAALLKREAEMAREIQAILATRDAELDRLRARAETLMEESTKNGADPQELTRLNREMRSVHDSYVTELRGIGGMQKREFREMIRRLHEDPTYMPTTHASRRASPSGPFGHGKNPFEEEHEEKSSHREPVNGHTPPPSRLEESFTIYLGAQLKTMHNARILEGSAIDVCRGEEPAGNGGGPDEDIHVRFQTEMSLYRRELSACVVLVGRDPRWHLLRRSEFARLCERSTELHFDSLEEQLNAVAEAATRANANRKPREGIREFINSSSLALGDVYCTRHSNIAGVHLVFHLVIDEADERLEMNSRHPYLAGIRNVVRLASRFGVTTIALSLLLTETIDDKLTPAWCSRRAELVFKCVKGYLMEICSTGWSSVSLGGASLSRAPHYNMVFLLPQGVSNEIYSQIVSIFPSVFHLVPSVTA